MPPISSLIKKAPKDPLEKVAKKKNLLTIGQGWQQN